MVSLIGAPAAEARKKKEGETQTDDGGRRTARPSALDVANALLRLRKRGECGITGESGEERIYCQIASDGTPHCVSWNRSGDINRNVRTMVEPRVQSDGRLAFDLESAPPDMRPILESMSPLSVRELLEKLPTIANRAVGSQK